MMGMMNTAMRCIQGGSCRTFHSVLFMFFSNSRGRCTQTPPPIAHMNFKCAGAKTIAEATYPRPSKARGLPPCLSNTVQPQGGLTPPFPLSEPRSTVQGRERKGKFGPTLMALTSPISGTPWQENYPDWARASPPIATCHQGGVCPRSLFFFAPRRNTALFAGKGGRG